VLTASVCSCDILSSFSFHSFYFGANMNWHHRLLPFPSKSRYSSTESTSPYSQSSEFCFTSIKALIFSSHFISTMVTGIRLPYPDNTIGWEIFYMIVYWFITISALFFGLHHITFLNSHFSFSFLFSLFSFSFLFLFFLSASKGNKTSNLKSLIVFIILIVPMVISNVYFIAWQVYVYEHWFSLYCKPTLFFS